ncbi:hypothetical protein CDAR_572731 [Caerostris darwini]|uniref:Uncharacterized protein n=1 Tax=Caerostris darwini TaxID=1538125 RepID=A0AAV4VU24_9ARAC|nr:hypothetical protein CDAR_572731 [Caerostris darwini]
MVGYRGCQKDIIGRPIEIVQGNRGSLLFHMWFSVVLEKHYPLRKLVPALVLDGLFEPQRLIAVLLSVNCCGPLFNSNFTCCDPTILPYGLVHSRNRGTVDQQRPPVPGRDKSLMFMRLVLQK